MKNVLELFYDQPGDWSGKGTYEEGCPFKRAVAMRTQYKEMLDASMTGEQQEMLEAYFDANAITAEIIGFNKFRYAFHLGAQMMAEILRGKEELLE